MELDGRMPRLSSALKDQEGAKKATCETLISFFFLKTGFKYRCLKFVCVCVCFNKTEVLPQVECCHLSFEVKSFGWLRLLPVKRVMTLGPGGPDLSHKRDLSWVPECLLIRSSLRLPSKHRMPFFCKGNANDRALD